MRILIIEDNDVRCDFFRDLLSGFQLTITSTSKEAISLIENELYEVIFLDMDLNDGIGRGLEVARRLGQTHNANASVIVHSMNISTAREVVKISQGALLLSIIEMRRIVALFGKEKLIEKIFE